LEQPLNQTISKDHRCIACISILACATRLKLAAVQESLGVKLPTHVQLCPFFYIM